ncbi:MAG: AAA family ATPase [FCB group bacterium]|nr:AAA family ATPase [FCB group bacterium]
MIDLSGAERQKEKKYRPPTGPPENPIAAFQAAMMEHGYEPGHIDTSGKLTRFDTEKKGDGAGWYVFFYDPSISGGAFGDWRSGKTVNWCSKSTGSMTDAEAAQHQKTVAEAQRVRDEQTKRNYAAGKIKAQKIWDQAMPCNGHEYLKKKGVPALGLKQSRGTILIPVLDINGDLHNIQFIKPDGEKKFLWRARVSDLMFPIPGNDQIYICEGYATGATIHKATGGTVICGFNGGNLPKAARAYRFRNPTAPITICADNDKFTAGNPGIKAGKETAREISAKLVIPDLTGLPGGDDPDLKLSDFNDLATISDIETVKKQISGSGGTSKLPPLTPDGSRVSTRLKARPAPLDFIFKYNDQGLIPRGVTGVLTATGGTGKTFFLLALAMAAASGGEFGPINAPKPISTLIIAGEDTQDELDRRLWDIGKGVFPSPLFAASVYGELGPLMRLDGATPVYADSYYWLEETIKNHAGLELLIIDPKSRFYGLDENNSDHATQWIQAIEGLSKRHGLTILFSHHTSKDTAGKISQNMSRGSSAIVDGCRWQGGLVRMDEETADKYCIENPRLYIMFDAPKSNYGEDLPGQICFKRGEGGVLEFDEPWKRRNKELSDMLYSLLKLDIVEYTARDLIRGKAGQDIAKEMGAAFPEFRRRRDMKIAIDALIEDCRLIAVEVITGGSGPTKTVLNTIDNN